ncbi:16S rRNA (guanine(527)-N(7))-methyltransferase RsmG [Sporomusa termitida]|uniref:Ribosomal RNA small subunit methyltransferase G n=1 Tax=Sporomusa termitida TaxID=2377 RepID=A0A517E0Q6_9FIRM|nr:16S rRNA (guanine(527)-N(7))-methyltransferase RsmG [Sporomusa termitida]QDR83086.1 Ribosomal RNA small subunit methyltransferase G [Sporomusa termitida]
MEDFKELLLQASTEYGLALSDNQLTAMDSYYQLLVEWNKKINLTAITRPQDVAVKHMIDSLSCYRQDIFNTDTCIIDVGTGAGFPGIPLKIYRPDLKLTLMDSLNKRLLFLQAVTDRLELREVELVHARAEEGGKGRQYREKFQIAVSRAVARLNILCELCLPFVRPGGWFIALKGAQYEEEVAEAARAIAILGGSIDRLEPVNLPGIADKRAVIYIKKMAATPAEYPRRPGTPEKKPL